MLSLCEADCEVGACSETFLTKTAAHESCKDCGVNSGATCSSSSQGWGPTCEISLCNKNFCFKNNYVFYMFCLKT